MSITSGSVRFERKINTGDYSHKLAEGHIAWTMEGETRTLNEVTVEASFYAVYQVATATATVVKLAQTPELVIGVMETPQTVTAAADTPQSSESTTVSAEPIPAASVAPRRGRPRSQPAQEVSTPSTVIAAPVSSSAAATVSPAETTPTATAVENTQSAPAEEPTAPPSAAPEISDRDLTDACSQKNQVLKQSDKIRALIGSYTQPGMSVITIPQDKRQEFLEALKELS